MGPSTPPHWLPYVRVEDCDRTARKAAELGARTLVPATDIARRRTLLGVRGPDRCGAGRHQAYAPRLRLRHIMMARLGMGGRGSKLPRDKAQGS